MSRQKANVTNSQAYWSLLITGSGVGWLVGLSAAPVVSIVITSVIGSAAALVAAMRAFEKSETDINQSDKKVEISGNVNPLPLMLLVVGIIVGSGLGVLARNNSLLGSDTSSEVKRWYRAGLTGAGVTEQEIVLRLFNSQYPSTSNATPRVIPAGGTVLFAVSA